MHRAHAQIIRFPLALRGLLHNSRERRVYWIEGQDNGSPERIAPCRSLSPPGSERLYYPELSQGFFLTPVKTHCSVRSVAAPRASLLVFVSMLHLPRFALVFASHLTC